MANPADGVADFLASRGISLPKGDPSDSTEDTVCGLGNRKQQIFRELLDAGVPVFESTVVLVRKLAEARVATAIYSSSRNCEQVLKAAGLGDLFAVRVDGVVAEALGLPGKPDPAVLLEATSRLGAAPERSVVIEDAEAGVQAGRNGGFAFVIGVDRTGHAEALLRCGADVVVPDLADVAVRSGDKRMSRLPNALDSYGQLIGVVGGRQPFVCLDFDGTLSEIVSDPDAATLVDGAAKALENLAARCPVAILSGRDLADIRDRVGLPGIWYAGSHGFELVGPDGSHHHNDAAASAVPVLESAATELREKLAQTPGVRVEHKRYAVAVHYRNVAPERVGGIVASVHRHGKRHGLRVTGGRKVIELRPDIDWDKGTALAWIRDQIHQTGRVLPIYVGDDLTDEDAFDAIRFDGVGVVVRHDEDGGRPTAAQFTLNNPGEVREFLRRGGNWLAYEQQTSNEAWTFTFEGYDPHNEKLREALCTVGNGYFATRGAAPESRAGQVHYPGTYAAGVYNRLDDVVAGTKTDNESLVNLPNWLPLTFRIDGGDWFDVDAVTLLSYRQTLDLRGAVLTRELRFRDDVGRTTSVTQNRFVAMHMAHVAALETTILAEDWSGTIEIRSMIDGNVRNSGVERYRELASTHLRPLNKRALSENSVSLTVETTQSQIPVALTARTTVWRDGSPAPATYGLVDEEFEIGHKIFTELAAGQSLSVEKVVTLVTGRDVAVRTGGGGRAKAGPPAAICPDTRCAHPRLGAHLGAVVDRIRRPRRRVAHSAAASAAFVADGLLQQRGARHRGACTRAAWRGISRSRLLGRAVHLPGAEPAAADGHPVAAGTGTAGWWRRVAPPSWPDTPARCSRGSPAVTAARKPGTASQPRSGRWNPDPSHRAHHIGIAVAYNVWQFYQVTGDLAYLIDYGAEMLVEIARFWVSRATYDKTRDRYGVDGVIGPDEFHSGYPDRRYDGIDNNAYTNVMAVWVILRAIDALELMPLPNRLDLREKLGLTTEELAHWDHVSRRMFVPFHDGVISQFEGYDELIELDWDAYRKRYGNIQRLDRILEAENDDVNRYKASKQADALMLLYLLSSDELRELLDRLDYHFGPDQIRRWSTTTWRARRTDRHSAVSCIRGARPGQPRSRDGVLRAGSQVRHRRHTGRHHVRGHSPRRDGRQRRSRAAVLHRAGNP